jgi:hypothetical protein
VNGPDPKAKLEPFEALAGGGFLIERSVNEHPDFPDSLGVIGVMEGDEDLSVQYFDSRGFNRIYEIAFDGRELTTKRDSPGFDQRSAATLSAEGKTLSGVAQLNENEQGWTDDLEFTYRRSEAG